MSTYTTPPHISQALADAAAERPYRVYTDARGHGVDRDAYLSSTHQTHALANEAAGRFNGAGSRIVALVRRADQRVPAGADFDCANAAASADAFVGRYGMPTYSELAASLRGYRAAYGNCGLPHQQHAADVAGALLDRLPACSGSQSSLTSHTMSEPAAAAEPVLPDHPPKTIELAAARTGVVMTFHFERFRATPSAKNCLLLHGWMLAHQRLLRGIPERHRAALLADLARSPITDWPVCIAAAPDL